MMNGWPEVELGQMCSITSTLADPRERRYSELPHVGGANIESESGVLCNLKSAKQDGLKSGKFIFDETMVLYSKIRPYLKKVARPAFRGLCSADIYPLSPDPALLDRNYLYHLLLSPDFTDFAVSGSARAGMPKINRDHLFTFRVRLPPLPEQRRIVRILDEAFDGIATAKANAEKNLQNARAIFESHLQSVFTKRGKGWAEAQLDTLTDPDSPITYGVVKPGDEGQITFVRGGDLVRGKVRLGQLRTITRAVSDQYRRTLLRGGELLICLVGQPGQVAVAPKELVGANIARQVGLIRLKESMNAEFVRYFLQSALGVEALGARESGSVQQVINLGELRQVSVPFPRRDVQDEIVEMLHGAGSDTQRLETVYQRKLSALDSLKKSLLHQAFTGDL